LSSEENRLEASNGPKLPPALVVMVRNPDAGGVKTRLAAAIGDHAAAALYRAFLLDLSRRLASCPAWELRWAFTPADAPLPLDLRGEINAFPQVGGDLGERMESAVARALADGHPSVVLIGSDIPHVSIVALEDAFRRLALGAPLVLGPAEDGGYYLVGATSLPPVFRGIRWGGPEVLSATIAAARRAGIEPAFVASNYDIDDHRGLERLRAEVSDGRVGDLPATEGVLERTLRLRYK
jgi:rSAM/selenodomain-associated transferase 1